MSDFVCVYQTFDAMEANIIKARLENEGIPCYLRTNDASGTLPNLGLIQGGIQILISPKDLDTYKKIFEGQ